MGASVQRSETATAAQFREIKSLGKSVFVSEHEADYANSMRILAENGLRPSTSQEALILISEIPELKDQLKGKWFYLAGKGLKEKDGIYTFDEKGNLVKVTGEVKPSREKTVCVWGGNQLLSLAVYADNFLRGQFYLTGRTSDSPAPVIVGIRKDASPEELSHITNTKDFARREK